jgi:hypothetical protein
VNGKSDSRKIGDSLNICMDLPHGLLLLAIGLLFTFLVLGVIVYAEQPKEDKEKNLNDVQKQIRDLFKYNGDKNQ